MNWPENPWTNLDLSAEEGPDTRPRDAVHLYDGPYPLIQTSDVKHANLYITDYNQTYSEAGWHRVNCSKQDV